jgi:subtilisin family serine protease
MIRLSVVLAGVSVGLLLTTPLAGAQDRRVDVAPPTPAPAFASDRVIVGWAPGADAADRRIARVEANVDSARRLGDPAVQLLELEEGQTVGDALEALQSDPAVEFAEPDRYNAPTAGVDEPFFDELWGLRNLGGPFGVLGFPGPVAGADIDAVAAWSRTVGTPSTVVAVIDSGYRFAHPDLGPVAWNNPGETPGNGEDDDDNDYVDDVHGYDFVGEDADDPSPDGDPTDADLLSGGHGVHTAGTIGADGDNGIGITGVAQNVRLMPLRVCSHSPDASAEEPPRPRSSCPDSALIDAIDYAGDNGASVANISLGRAGFPSSAVVDALGRHPDTLYVISAGNDGSDNDTEADPPNGHHYPCNHDPSSSDEPGAIDNVICVAATDQADQLASFSNWGAVSVDLAAPGTQTLSTYSAIGERYSEDFENGDFGSEWSATAPNGFQSADDGPLSSPGMTDTPAGAPAPSTIYESTTTTGFTVPAGYGPCNFGGERFLRKGAGDFKYWILRNGNPVIERSPGDTSGSSLSGFSTGFVTGLAGGTIKLRFQFVSDGSPTVGEGVWLDDLWVDCYEDVGSTTPTYVYLQGTSMAAPHVAGAAGLLVSLDPSATVPELRAALLDGTVPNRSSLCDPVTDLDNRRTVTGGRLNVDRSMDVLMEDPLAPMTPPVCGEPPTPLSGPGADQRPMTGNGDRDPVLLQLRCKVPKLKVLSRSKASAKLKKANCRLGKVTKPKKKKGQKKLPALIVKSSSPKAGAERAAGAKVAVTLKVKPKWRKRR